jgi:hypothetical protein
MSTLLTRSPADRRLHDGGLWPAADEPERLGDLPSPRHDDRTGPEHHDRTGPKREDLTGPTLDDVISRAWEVLRADVPAACPACGGELEPRHSAGAGVVGGRCNSCGATLW